MERHSRHSLISGAPARELYELAADVTRWPAMFEPTVYVHHLERDAHTERFRMWARVNGTVQSWVSRRELDPEGLRIRFDQEASASPVAGMGGEWIFHPLPGGGTEIVLTHDFRAIGDDPESVRWIEEGLDRNSPVELAALARVAEQGLAAQELIFTFADTVTLDCSPATAYEFINRSDLWPQRLPHVQRVHLTEEVPHVQLMDMDTVTRDGSAHTTKSVRVCRPGEWIAYKQLVTPRLLAGHSGRWLFAACPGGTQVVAEHTAALDPSAIHEVLGAAATPAEARAYVRSALGTNSRTTLNGAAVYAS
jgi:aromatase